MRTQSSGDRCQSCLVVLLRLSLFCCQTSLLDLLVIKSDFLDGMTVLYPFPPMAFYLENTSHTLI